MRDSKGESLQQLEDARVGVLTTYRRSGEPVATPVSIGVRNGRAYFVTPATSGKARRLAVRTDVTLAPSKVSGRATGPPIHGRARQLTKADRERPSRLVHPGGRLFWSYLLYRIRGHRLHMFEVRFAEPGERPADAVS